MPETTSSSFCAHRELNSFNTLGFMVSKGGWDSRSLRADIQLTTKGSAPTTTEWTLTAIDTIINPAINNGADRMEWYGTLNPGDVMIVSKDGAVSINGSSSGNISGTVPEADAGKNTFVYSDDPSSSHNCTIEVTWNDAYY